MDTVFRASNFLKGYTNNHYFYMLLIVVITIILAYLAEYILKKLLVAAHKTSWDLDDIILDSIKGLPKYLTFILGLAVLVRHSILREEFASYILLLIKIISIILVAKYTYNLTSRLIKTKLNKVAGGLFNSSIFYNILRISFILLSFILIMNILNISITPILTALGVGGLAVALALQPTLSNLFSGLQILASKQVVKNDFIRLSSGEEGIVSDINWRHTIIQALSNNTYIIPNSKLLEDIIVNYEKPNSEMSVIVPLGVSYNSNLDKVENLSLEVAKKVMKKVDPDAKGTPLFRYKSFEDSYIKLIVILKVSKFEKQFLLKHEFIKAIHKAYNKNDIVIPYPINTVILENGDKNVK